MQEPPDLSSQPQRKRNIISKERWEEILDDLSAATREWMQRRYENAPMGGDTIENVFLGQMPPEYGPRVVLEEEEIELETEFEAEIRLKFEYGGIVPGRISLDYELNAVRVAFRLPGEMETVNETGEVTLSNELEV